MEDQNSQLVFHNEYTIMKLAASRNLKNILKSEGLVVSASLVGIASKKYEMTLRKYLTSHRDPA